MTSADAVHDPVPKPAGVTRVATANLQGFQAGNEAARAACFEELGIDVVCAQELSRSRFEALRVALGPGWWGVHSLTARADHPQPGHYWGVAVLGRRDAVSYRGGADVIGDPADDPARGCSGGGPWSCRSPRRLGNPAPSRRCMCGPARRSVSRSWRS